MANDKIRVDNPDSHGTATEADLPWVWQELSEFLMEAHGEKLIPLDQMDREQKTTLLTCAVNDSLWVSEGKIDIDVQESIYGQDILADCIAD